MHDDPTVPLSDDHNEIVLAGRLSRAPEARTLPSGDEVVLLRVVAARPDGGSDSIPVAVGPAPKRGQRRRRGQATATTVRRARRLEAGDRVAVTGWLQRRFWDAGSARRTRLQVVAAEVEVRPS